MMRFSPNGSTKNLVFGDVKLLLKFEGHHSRRNNFLHVPSFWEVKNL